MQQQPQPLKGKKGLQEKTESVFGTPQVVHLSWIAGYMRKGDSKRGYVGHSEFDFFGRICGVLQEFYKRRSSHRHTCAFRKTLWLQ